MGMLSDAEKLDARAQALNVTVTSLRRCQHVESLVYFDRVYGTQCSWQVCDYCEQTFNMTPLEEHTDLLEACD